MIYREGCETHLLQIRMQYSECRREGILRKLSNSVFEIREAFPRVISLEQALVGE